MKVVKSKSVTILQYFIITDSDDTNFYHIPKEFHGCLSFLREVPRDIIQISNSIEYYEAVSSNKLFQGLDLYMINSDLILELSENNVIEFFVNFFSSESNVKIFLINEHVNGLEKILEQLKKIKGILFFYGFNKKNNKVKKSFPKRYFDNIFEFFILLEENTIQLKQALKSYSKEYQDLDFKIKMTTNFNGYDDYEHFLPAVPNFFTLNQITRNYWSKSVEIKFEKAKEILKKEVNGKNRWGILLDKVKKIDYIRCQLYVNKICPPISQYDPFYESIILVFPYQNPKLKDILNIKSPSKDEKLMLKILATEQNLDFKNVIEFSDEISIEKAKKLLGISVIREQERLGYIDSVAYLHASFQYSPIIRFPILGKSINKYLSFFKPERNNFSTSSPKKTIWNFGRILAEKTTPDTVSEYLLKRNGQVFVISDLPIEWMQLKGIPLCFTHDICRLPETNYRSLLNNYIVNQRFTHTIEGNILEKTLVILGASNKENKDEEFKKWYPIVFNLSEEYNFKVVNCRSKEDVIEAVELNNPELLIFDCHGGFDEKTRSTFLWINEDKLTGEEIIKNNISAPIVFLSACNTSPNYGYIGLIGEAFFQAGAVSVTTTFLPIGVDEGTILYIRLLNNLYPAAKKSIHQNWLNFVSHLVRTSIIHRAFYKKLKSTELNDKQTEELASLLSDSMIFDKRRDVYNKIDILNIENEYLFYSNLGRSDLIFFESWLNEKTTKK